MKVYVSPKDASNCQVDANCPVLGQVCRSGRCAEEKPVGLSSGAIQYAKCDGVVMRNVVRFDETAVPESLSTVEICYDVKSDFQSSCP